MSPNLDLLIRFSYLMRDNPVANEFVRKVNFRIAICANVAYDGRITYCYLACSLSPSLALSLSLSFSCQIDHSPAEFSCKNPLLSSFAKSFIAFFLVCVAMRLWAGNNHVAEFEQGQKRRPSPSYLIDLFPISTGNENGSAGPGPVT